MRPERGNTSRPPAVAGLFYPDDERELRDVVSEYLRQHSAAGSAAPPKALIVPHAGYIYSGGIAAAAYATVASLRQIVRRIVLIGPSHRVYLRGMAVPAASSFATPLGAVAIDRELKASLCCNAGTSSKPMRRTRRSTAWKFSCRSCNCCSTISRCCRSCSAPLRRNTSPLRSRRCGATRATLVLVSSDLSHYHTYTQARQIDAGDERRDPAP